MLYQMLIKVLSNKIDTSDCILLILIPNLYNKFVHMIISYTS